MLRRVCYCVVCSILATAITAGPAAGQSVQYPGPSTERADASNRALKASLDLPTLSPSSVASRLMRQEYAQIEKDYRQNLESYRQNPDYESPLQKGYDLFAPGNEIAPSYFEAWINGTGSDIAYAARGYYRMAKAGSARGTNAIRDVPQRDVNAMQQFCDEAAADFRVAVRKNPELTPAWLGLVRLSMMAAMPFSPDDIYQEAIKHDQRSFYLRLQYMKSLEPRWGGSYDAMAAFGYLCAQDANLNPRIWSILGSMFADVGSLLAQEGDHRRAVEMYSQALSYGDKLDWLQYRSNSLSMFEEYEKAMIDLEKILYYSPDHKNALTMMTRFRKLQSQKG